MRSSKPRTLAVRALASTGRRLTQLSERLRPAVEAEGAGREPTLSGDRDVEWAWCTAHLRTAPGRVLDLGAGNGVLSLAAAFRGHAVVAVDLEPDQFAFVHERIDFRQGDFNAMQLEAESFDQVINCSTIEHVGLAGRYGSRDDADGDLRAMERLAELLTPDGDMLLTLPVGRDGVFAPWHRVYGDERLPRLLERFTVREQSFRAKPHGHRWEEVDRAAALGVEASATLYALGLFVLARR
jgi:SAM-dependent methyltransferase